MSEKSMRKIEVHDETQPGRYDYIEKINIKSKEPGIEILPSVIARNRKNLVKA